MKALKFLVFVLIFALPQIALTQEKEKKKKVEGKEKVEDFVIYQIDKRLNHVEGEISQLRGEINQLRGDTWITTIFTLFGFMISIMRIIKGGKSLN